ncbi:MAG: prolyl oligopeptidase family serine peptidase [Acidobacteria bacterium]|nr:prolyl oligopeptidase family serine peptidase [Acidobacteriota bacterium]
MKQRIILAIAALMLAAALPGQSTGEVRIDTWLVLGPAELLADGADAALDWDFVSPVGLNPAAGLKVRWHAERSLAWRESAPRFTASSRPQAVYLAAYVESRRWLRADLALDSPFPVRVFLDGALLPQAPAGNGEGKKSFDLALDSGKHLLLVKAILPPQGDAVMAGKDRVLQAVLKRKPAFANAPLSLSLSPDRRIRMEDLLHSLAINEVFMSPDGRHVAVALSQLERGATGSRRWIEILESDNGGRVFTSQGLGEISGFQWLDDSRRFSYLRSEKDASDLYLYDLGDRSCRLLLPGEKNLSDYWWAPDGSFLVYATAEEPAADKPYRHVRKLDDRSRSPEPRQALALFFPTSGVRQPLAGLADNFSQVRVSPDNRTLLLVSRREDHRQRPYQRNTLFLHQLADGRREKLLDDPWVNDFLWSPDSRKLLLLGGPSAFSGLGSTLPAGVIPNDFDTQAYVFDLKTKKAEALTRSFAPAIDQAFWHPNGSVLLKASDQDLDRLYRCLPAAKRFVRLETAVDALESVSFSKAGRAAYSGSALGRPQKLYLLNLDGGSRVLKDYNREAFAAVRFGRTESWSFKAREGKVIGGFICYPPDFDPARLWPCIVNFYGGTSPIGRNFGGRYPLDWYAANGYVICVIQPSGAVGYGQEFSSAHVNDWGEITAGEIIRGVEELLRTHPFIDNRRVGAIGASYGGFMTQLLATQTDLFACLISHAGISSLSSYWGVGDWGYNYSAVATADSFPWNRKDLYVGHSPLFMAERVSKPLLLLHGQEDNNVPPGESYQMFAALKLLNKEAALVTFPDQEHWILKFPQRVRWMRTIMAWFDRWLKGEGEWWEELYPE